MTRTHYFEKKKKRITYLRGDRRFMSLGDETPKRGR